MTSVRRPIPFSYCPLWMALLAAALVVFYVFLTPVWMAIRAIAWLSERGPNMRRRPRRGPPD